MAKVVAYHLPGAWGLVSVSPFCLKLDAFLRLTGIEHEAVTATTPFGGPKGKAPWIEHEGRKIGDSTLIILYLKQRFGVDPNAQLSAEQQGMALAIQRMIEENLYWAMVHDRWNTPENWPVLKATVLGGLPVLPRALLAPFARRGVRKQLLAQGMGNHSAQEIAAIGARDIDALAALLGHKPWFFGDTPTETDCVAYGQLANIHSVAFSSPMQGVIAGHANLVSFIERFTARFYP